MSLSVLWLAYLGALSHKGHISKPGPKGLEFYFYFHTHGFLQATQVLQRTPSIVWTFSWIIFSFTCLDTCSYMVILWKKLSICMLSYINLSVGEGHRDQLRLGKAVPQPEPVRWATPQVGTQRSDQVIWIWGPLGRLPVWSVWNETQTTEFSCDFKEWWLPDTLTF